MRSADPRNHLPRLFVFVLVLILSGCASKPPAAFQEGRPIFTPEKYFAGHTHSSGVFETRTGAPWKKLRTTTDGHMEADGLHFEQDFFFEGEKKSHRSWLIRRADAHHYTATGTGVIGVARGEAYGNLLHLHFTLDALPGNPLGHLHMTQWMYLQADGVTMINRATLTKAGVVVAHVTEQFHKDR